MESFTLLKNTVYDVLRAQPVQPEGLQAVAVLTTEKNVYCVTGIASDGIDRISEKLLRDLQTHGDTTVTHIVCMWADETLDLPHVRVRRGLIELNGRNLDAKVMLQNGTQAKLLNYEGQLQK